MYRGTLVTLAWVLLTCVLATPVKYRDYEIHEKREVPSKSWSAHKRLPQHHVVPIKIGLKQSNIANGSVHLLDISNPDSPNYGKHWSSKDIEGFFQPPSVAIETVQAWLSSANIARDRVTYSRGRAMLSFQATVAEAESLLDTSFHEYRHSKSDARSIGCDSYSLPRHVREHVDIVTPTLARTRSALKSKRRPSPVAKRDALSTDPGTKNCENGTQVSPYCIRTLYNITQFLGPPSKNNSMGIFNTEDLGNNTGSYSQADLNSFFANFSSNIPQGTHPIPASINGGIVEVSDPTKEGSEPMLDYSVSYPIIYPQKITAFVSSDNYAPVYNATDQQAANTGIETFFDAIDSSYCAGAASNGTKQCGVYNVTNVVSISYGTSENDINYSYAVSVCNEIMKLGLRGVTVLAAAGDGKVGVPGEEACGGESGNVFLPDWLATCPWITAVGGTEIGYLKDVTQPNAEIAWSGSYTFGSGGGFSNYYAMPDYQKDDVQSYLKTANLSFSSYAQFVNHSGAALGAGTNGYFNRLGRAYPDVSALASGIQLFYYGMSTTLDGTSAATPLWGAIITRINEERLVAGKGTVGFINPVLYKNPDAMHDITVGSNAACEDDVGFSAQKGWDPVTGLGSPQFHKLMEVFTKLP